MKTIVRALSFTVFVMLLLVRSAEVISQDNDTQIPLHSDNEPVAEAQTSSELDAVAIVKKADHIRAPKQPFKFDLNLVELVDDEEKNTAGLSVYVKGQQGERLEYKSLVRFNAPAYNKGRVLLMSGNELWLYIPGTRRSIRISPQQRLLGQVSNGDVVSINFQNDYNPTLLGSETVMNKDCYSLQLDAVDESSAYAKILYWVAKDDFHPVKAEYYVISGRLLKTAYFGGYQEALGNMRPTKVAIIDGLHRNKKTIMNYYGYEFQELEDKYFDREYLKYIK